MTFTAAAPASRQQWTGPEIALMCGSFTALVVIVLIVVSLLAREHEDASEAASRAAANIVRLIDADVVRNAELYDTALLGMINAWQHPGLQSIAPDLRHMVLFDRSTAARYKGDLLLLDAEGNALADSTSVQPRPLNLSDRPNFQAHKNDPSLEMKVGPPFKSEWGFKDWCISFSRRIPSQDGAFVGVVSAAMRLVYFKQLFSTLDVGPDSHVTLLNTDGVVLARQPEVSGQETVGHSFIKSPNYHRVIGGGDGSFVSISTMDGKERLYTFSHVAHLPLIVAIGQSTHEVFAVWRRNVVLVGGATGLLCVGIIWLTVLLRRELHLRRRAESELQHRAATDALTGLPNRRRLDEVLATEWARAQRTGSLLSLLMIDIDSFKAFNDRHGHNGGDEALRSVANTIAATLGRSQDFVGRYGGEEFLAVLPGTDQEGSMAVADNIRAAVNAMLPFASDTDPITVSVGVASRRVKPGDTLQTLFRAADAALYSAKNNGRNRTEAATAY
jgi:diguanylate cyclase (GGDEF)-like protein